jgi:hypothetical protein
MLSLTLSTSDPLGVLSSTLPVVQRARQVRLDLASIEALAARWAREGWHAPAWDAALHFNDGTERTLNWMLLTDAMNFCFWAEANQPRWTVEYRGQTYDGYLAEAASLMRAIDEGRPLWDAAYLADLSAAELHTIFRPTPGAPDIPLFAERLANARETGRVLLETYGGQFAHAIEAAGSNAIALVQRIVQDFPSFNDIAWYDGAEVRLYKRAQICAADIHGIFGGQRWGDLGDLDHLTIFADYKLPQLLRREGILAYAPDLAARIDRLDLLPAGSQEEVEIRAATVWAGELLRRALARRGIQARASEIDYHLWLLSQAKSPQDRPYHRTRTIYY